jgi:phage gp36-like protein
MAYSTDEDILDRLGRQKVQQLSDDDSTGHVNTQLLAAVREQAARRINAKLRRRYDLPIEHEEAVELLADLETDIVAYRLYTRRSTVEVPESVKDAKDDAWDEVREIARHGGLGVDQDGDGADDGGSTLQVRSTDRETLRDKTQRF